MTPNDEIYWQIVTTIMQIDGLVRWMDAHHESLSPPTVIFLGYTIRKLHLYVTTLGGIVWDPTNYQVQPRLIF